MGKRMGLTSLLLLLPLTMAAQDYPKNRIYVGATVGRYGGGKFQNPPDFSVSEDANTPVGWFVAAFERNLKSWLALGIEVTGNYGKNDLAVTSSPAEFFKLIANDRSHIFLWGTRFSSQRSKNIIPFVKTGLGVSHETIDAEETVFTSGGLVMVRVKKTSARFAMAAGAGIDIPLTNTLDFRLIQADYLLTAGDEQIRNNARITFGFVVNF